MARANATNFTGGLQFPYANAATDLFKKEDVQVLAQAVDQHTHGAGLGLPIEAGAIPNGLITSAMIADGTIATVDLAANAVSALLVDVPMASSFSTTTTSTWIETNVQGTATFTGTLVRIDIRASVQHSVSNALAYIGWGLDGTIQQSMGYVGLAFTAGYPQLLTAFTHANITAGSHRVAIMVQTTTAGTLSFRSEAQAQISAREIRR